MPRSAPNRSSGYITIETGKCCYTIGEFSTQCIDGVTECDDNCPTTPNGPSLGTCTVGLTGTCLADVDCETSAGAEVWAHPRD